MSSSINWFDDVFEKCTPYPAYILASYIYGYCSFTCAMVLCYAFDIGMVWGEKTCLYCKKSKESAEAFESEAREFLEKVQRLEDVS